MPAVEATAEKPLPTIWELPDELWERIEPILARHYPPARTGSPPRRSAAHARRDYLPDAVGLSVEPAARALGPSSTAHGWFGRLVADGVLREIWACLIAECEALGAVRWEWQAADGVMGKSRLEGGERGPNPTDRAKPGTKKSVIVEQHGGPLGVAIAGANVHDTKLLEATISAIVVERPDPAELIQHLCLDKAYDNPTGAAACQAGGYLPHIRRIGEEKLDQAGEKTHPARRWVVERTIAWLQKCRAILIRYDKKPANYQGLIQLACALLWSRRLHRLDRSRPVSG